jgi:hypothetical protein
MWKSFVLEPHGEWSEFATEYDHSAPLTHLCRQRMQRNAAIDWLLG